MNKYKTAIAIMAVVGWSGVVAASELIDFNEQDKLNNINSAYEQQYGSLNIDESISHYNELNTEIESNKIKLESSIDMIKSDSTRLKDKLIDGVYDESLILTLRNMSAKVNSMKTDIETAGKLLVETKQQLSNKQQKASQFEREKSDALLSLYEQIKSRHLDESKRVINDSYSGRLQCNVSESLSTCVNRNLPSIKNAFVLSKGGLSRIKLTNFRVIDATQKLNGDLSFTADASYKHNYSANTEVELRQALGLDKVRFVFRSNSPQTVFYINDQEVGSGERVDVAGNYVGIYNVRVTNGDKIQSLKLNLENGGDYFFPFSSLVSTPKASPNKVITEGANKPHKSQASTGFSKSILQPRTAETVKSPGKKETNQYANKVLYKDKAFTYLIPKLRENSKTQDVFLNRADAMQYCERLSSSLPSQTAYEYLAQNAHLVSGSYWTKQGQVYSFGQGGKHDKTSENKFICLLNMS
ncbi:hypothetical protein [Vibrio minamisatsumaniensis]|uniref:hypothetical protein n=1 Tax=Vibrio minamisatsumaniensis TaxID=2910243 RepID=UPI003D1D1D40